MSFSDKHPRILLTVVLLILAFIWGNSLVPGDVSVSVSTYITEMLGGEVVEKEDNESDVEIRDDEWYLRKACHLTEFLVLGGAFTLLVMPREGSRREKILLLSGAGLFVPLMDETLQLFSGRNGVIRDVWIDIAGYTMGCLLVFGIAAARRSRRKERGDPHDGGDGFDH